MREEPGEEAERPLKAARPLNVHPHPPMPANVNGMERNDRTILFLDGETIVKLTESETLHADRREGNVIVNPITNA